MLKVQFDLQHRLNELDHSGVELDGFDSVGEICEIILDSLGFPRDGTPLDTSKAKDGQPVFARDYIVEQYYDLIKNGTDKEFQNLLAKWKELASDMSCFYLLDEY